MEQPQTIHYLVLKSQVDRRSGSGVFKPRKKMFQNSWFLFVTWPYQWIKCISIVKEGESLGENSYHFLKGCLGSKKEKMTMIQLFNRLIIMDVSNWETNCHIKWQFWFGFCRFVVLYSIYCAYWRVQVRSYKYYTSKWHFQNICWAKKRLLKSKLRLKNGWPSKPAFWSAFWHNQSIWQVLWRIRVKKSDLNGHYNGKCCVSRKINDFFGLSVEDTKSWWYLQYWIGFLHLCLHV